MFYGYHFLRDLALLFGRIQGQWRFQNQSVPLNVTMLLVHLPKVGAGAFKEDDSDEAVTEGSWHCRECRCQMDLQRQDETGRKKQRR